MLLTKDFVCFVCFSYFFFFFNDTATTEIYTLSLHDALPISATKPDTNLARCFLCARNFNTIDMTLICRRVSFVEGVTFLQTFYADIQKRKCRQAELEQLLKRMTKTF